MASSFTIVVGKIMTSKEVHGLSPRTWDYVPLYGTRDFVGVIMAKNLSWEDYPGLSHGPSIITRVLKRRTGESEREAGTLLEE